MLFEECRIRASQQNPHSFGGVIQLFGAEAILLSEMFRADVMRSVGALSTQAKYPDATKDICVATGQCST